MTSLPEPRPGQKQLGLVIDLDICVGCQACATACKEWNTSGHMGPLPDFNPYGAGAWGVWFNRVHSFEEGDGEGARTVYFPKSCLHCEEPACVTVCPTGASYKRAEDAAQPPATRHPPSRLPRRQRRRGDSCGILVPDVDLRRFGILGDDPLMLGQNRVDPGRRRAAIGQFLSIR